MSNARKTKKEKAVTIYNRLLAKGKSRGDVLKELQSKLEMTEYCAKRYYQMINAEAKA